MEGREVLIYLDIYYNHKWDRIYSALKDYKDLDIFEEPEVLKLDVEKFKLFNEGYRVLTFLDTEEYPQRIMHSVFKPPFVIWYKGSLTTVEDRFFEQYGGVETDLKRLQKGCFIE